MATTTSADTRRRAGRKPQAAREEAQGLAEENRDAIAKLEAAIDAYAADKLPLIDGEPPTCASWWRFIASPPSPLEFASVTRTPAKFPGIQLERFTARFLKPYSVQRAAPTFGSATMLAALAAINEAEPPEIAREVRRLSLPVRARQVDESMMSRITDLGEKGLKGSAIHAQLFGSDRAATEAAGKPWISRQRVDQILKQYAVRDGGPKPKANKRKK